MQTAKDKAMEIYAGFRSILDYTPAVFDRFEMAKSCSFFHVNMIKRNLHKSLFMINADSYNDNYTVLYKHMKPMEEYWYNVEYELTKIDY